MPKSSLSLHFQARVALALEITVWNAAEEVAAEAETAATILTVEVVATIMEAVEVVEAGQDLQELEAMEAIITVVMDQMWTGLIVKQCLQFYEANNL